MEPNGCAQQIGMAEFPFGKSQGRDQDAGLQGKRQVCFQLPLSCLYAQGAIDGFGNAYQQT